MEPKIVKWVLWAKLNWIKIDGQAKEGKKKRNSSCEFICFYILGNLCSFHAILWALDTSKFSLNVDGSSKAKEWVNKMNNGSDGGNEEVEGHEPILDIRPSR